MHSEISQITYFNMTVFRSVPKSAFFRLYCITCLLTLWLKEMLRFAILETTRKNYVNTEEAKKKVYQLKCRLIATFVSHGLDILELQ